MEKNETVHIKPEGADEVVGELSRMILQGTARFERVDDNTGISVTSIGQSMRIAPVYDSGDPDAVALREKREEDDRVADQINDNVLASILGAYW